MWAVASTGNKWGSSASPCFINDAFSDVRKDDYLFLSYTAVEDKKVIQNRKDIVATTSLPVFD